MSKVRQPGQSRNKKARADRNLSVKVKTAKGRKLSSTRWLQRQLNDPYVEAAKKDGLRSRAAYKLIEIDDKHKILKPGQVVVDLGAAPGGWSQVAVNRVGVDLDLNRVIALDLSDMDAIPGVTFIKCDFYEEASLQQLSEALQGRAVDVVLSDMAAPATGHKKTDHLRIMGLCEAAYEFALEMLSPGGSFLAKVLQGGTENELLNDMKQTFDKVIHVKPKASRSDSSEKYVLATGFRG